MRLSLLLMLAFCLVLPNANGYVGFMQKWKEPKELKEKLEETAKDVKEGVENWHKNHERTMKETWNEQKPIVIQHRESMRNKAGKVWMKFKGRILETNKNRIGKFETKMTNGEENLGLLRGVMKTIQVRTRNIVKSLKGLMRPERKLVNEHQKKLMLPLPSSTMIPEPSEVVTSGMGPESVDPEVDTPDKPVNPDKKNSELSTMTPQPSEVVTSGMGPESVDPEVDTPDKPVNRDKKNSELSTMTPQPSEVVTSGMGPESVDPEVDTPDKPVNRDKKNSELSTMTPQPSEGVTSGMGPESVDPEVNTPVKQYV